VAVALHGVKHVKKELQRILHQGKCLKKKTKDIGTFLVGARLLYLVGIVSYVWLRSHELLANNWLLRGTV